MSTRISNLLLLLALGACQEPRTDTKVLAKVEAAQDDAAVEDGRVKCALAGAAAFRRVCTVDREQGPEGLILTIHHPDGGFRRLLVTRDGRGVVAADGAHGWPHLRVRLSRRQLRDDEHADRVSRG